MFNVTHGNGRHLSGLYDVTFLIDIVPSTIPLEVGDVLVKEGDRVYISKDKVIKMNKNDKKCIDDDDEYLESVMSLGQIIFINNCFHIQYVSHF